MFRIRRSSPMSIRRPWLSAALALVAVLIQANAPVRSAVMAASPEAALCEVHVSRDGHGSVEQRKAPPAKREACAACVICHLASPTPLVAAVTIPPPNVERVAAPTLPREVSPRAPPTAEPRARGPPTYA